MRGGQRPASLARRQAYSLRQVRRDGNLGNVGCNQPRLASKPNPRTSRKKNGVQVSRRNFGGGAGNRGDAVTVKPGVQIGLPKQSDFARRFEAGERAERAPRTDRAGLLMKIIGGLSLVEKVARRSWFALLCSHTVANMARHALTRHQLEVGQAAN